jgi:hypothetical protein
MKTLATFIVGFVVGSIGLTGTMNIITNGLAKVQEVSKEAAK